MNIVSPFNAQPQIGREEKRVDRGRRVGKREGRKGWSGSELWTKAIRGRRDKSGRKQLKKKRSSGTEGEV